jgi:hypothetical protein
MPVGFDTSKVFCTKVTAFEYYLNELGNLSLKILPGFHN